MRAQAGQARQRNAQAVQVATWIIALVVLAILAPFAYHAAYGAYEEFHYKSVTANAIKSCDGPVTDSMPPYQRDQINQCLAKDEDLLKAQADYDAYKAATASPTGKARSH